MHLKWTFGQRRSKDVEIAIHTVIGSLHLRAELNSASLYFISNKNNKVRNKTTQGSVEFFKLGGGATSEGLTC